MLRMSAQLYYTTTEAMWKQTKYETISVIIKYLFVVVFAQVSAQTHYKLHKVKGNSRWKKCIYSWKRNFVDYDRCPGISMVRKMRTYPHTLRYYCNYSSIVIGDMCSSRIYMVESNLTTHLDLVGFGDESETISIAWTKSEKNKTCVRSETCFSINISSNEIIFRRAH